MPSASSKAKAQAKTQRAKRNLKKMEEKPTTGAAASAAAPVSSSSGSGSGDASAPPAALPRRLRASVGQAAPLAGGGSQVLRQLASRQAGEAASRESLAGLYALAAGLHSRELKYHAARLETSAARHVTPEQIWGQMSVLLRPVLRQLQNRVRLAQKTYGAAKAAAGGSSRTAAAAGSGSSGEEAEESGAEGEEDEDGQGSLPAGGDDSVRSSELSEGDLDEEIAALLKAREAKRKARKGAAAAGGGDGAGGGDDWRYVFGRPDAGDDDGDDWGDAQPHKRRGSDDDVDGGEGDEDEEEAEEGFDFGSDAADRRRRRDRNARAMLDAAAEEGDEEGDAEEELAALKEMYGDDFEDDGRGLLGDGSDGELEQDMLEDDPARDGEGGYTDGDGHYWGKGDMLNDPAGDYEDDGGAAFGFRGDGAGAEAGEEGEGDGEEMDAELAAALADPSLTELQRERLRERHHVAQLEQRRLYSTDWAMAGETAAGKRPREALLEEELEVDYGMKAAPVVTEAFTARLEERIKTRIAEGRFDDVAKPELLSAPEDLNTTKRDAAIEAQKSKMSLMDLYEKEFLDKARRAEEAAGTEAAAAEPLTEVEKDELRAVQMWKRLAQHLDALSNFHFTPKPAQQDLEARVRAVDQRTAAIALETVGNFATTRAAALAPQDLYRGSSRKFADVGSDELLPAERRALRRAKKDAGANAKRHTEATKARQAEQNKKNKEKKAAEAAKK